MNLNLNKNVEMSEDEIELEHENILFMQPMWKWQTNWIGVMTWTWRLGAALKILKFAWIKMNMNLSMRHSCNKCGNEWRFFYDWITSIPIEKRLQVMWSYHSKIFQIIIVCMDLISTVQPWTRFPQLQQNTKTKGKSQSIFARTNHKSSHWF